MPTAPRYKYLDALITAFVVILLVSNLVAQKICRIGPFDVSGAILLFPITYIFGDIFTEVYGYAASRRAIWLGFFGTALLYAVSALVNLGYKPVEATRLLKSLGRDIAPGEYVLQVIVTDKLAPSKFNTATQSMDFEIEP